MDDENLIGLNVEIGDADTQVISSEDDMLMSLSFRISHHPDGKIIMDPDFGIDVEEIVETKQTQESEAEEEVVNKSILSQTELEEGIEIIVGDPIPSKLEKDNKTHDNIYLCSQQVQMKDGELPSSTTVAKIMHDHNLAKSPNFLSNTYNCNSISNNNNNTFQSSSHLLKPILPNNTQSNQPVQNVLLANFDGKAIQFSPGCQILPFGNTNQVPISFTPNQPLILPHGYQLVNLPSITNNAGGSTSTSQPATQLVLQSSINSDGMPVITTIEGNNFELDKSMSNENKSCEESESVEIVEILPTNEDNNESLNLKTTKKCLKSNSTAQLNSTSVNVNVNINPQSASRFIFVSGLCRVCLRKKENMSSIFEDVSIGANGVIENSRGPHAASRYNIIPAIKTLLDIDVGYGDGLPDTLCMECNDKLMDFSVYRKKISIGQTKLTEVLTQVRGCPNLTVINELGETDFRKTDVYRHSEAILKAQKLISNSPYSHLVVRFLPDRVLEKIFAAMAGMVGFKSGKLKFLETYAIDTPFIRGFFCYPCNLTIHGPKEAYISHCEEIHEKSAGDILFPCDICGVAFQLLDASGISQNYAEHFLQHFFFHECPTCNKRMPSLKGLWVHKRSAHSIGDKVHQCDVGDCDKSFVKRAHLEAHKKTHLDKEDRKKHLNWCRLCGKGLTSSLSAHMASVHSDDRPWKCEMCNKRFKRKEILNGHRESVHYNVKKFQCEICGEFLKSHSTKTLHVLRHTGEKPHACPHETCQKRFYSNHALKSHLIKHKEVGDVSCGVCGKSFKRKLYLIEHMRIHTNEKPYECAQCGKQIRMKSNYFKHLKVHKKRDEESAKL